MGFVDYKGPDLDKYIVGKKHKWVTYEEGAKLYDIPYWTFVHLAKEAKATMPLRKTAVVDLVIFEPYFMSVMQRKDPVSRIGKGGKRKKKFVRYDEGAALYSVGLHTFMDLAKEAKAIYRVKRMVLVNIDIIDAYLENFREEE